MPHIVKISDAESEVMKVLWVSQTPMTERNILDALDEESDWSPTTIKTLLKRLLEKGAVKREKKEVFYYSPILEEMDFAKDRTADLLNKVFGGNAKNLVSTMIHQDMISAEEMDELKSYWEKGKHKK